MLGDIWKHVVKHFTRTLCGSCSEPQLRKGQACLSADRTCARALSELQSAQQRRQCTVNSATSAARSAQDGTCLQQQQSRALLMTLALLC